MTQRYVKIVPSLCSDIGVKNELHNTSVNKLYHHVSWAAVAFKSDGQSRSDAFIRIPSYIRIPDPFCIGRSQMPIMDPPKNAEEKRMDGWTTSRIMVQKPVSITDLSERSFFFLRNCNNAALS